MTFTDYIFMLSLRKKCARDRKSGSNKFFNFCFGLFGSLQFSVVLYVPVVARW